jgi:hypothetical protein
MFLHAVNLAGEIGLHAGFLFRRDSRLRHRTGG